MSLKNIRSLYFQKGHLFYRDGMTFSQHSAQSFYYVKKFQQNRLENDKQKDILLLASTFHNIGKMIDKKATTRFTSGFLHVKNFPLDVSKTVYLQDMAKRYLLTENKNLLITSSYIHKELLSIGWTLNEGERQYFMGEKMFPIALLVAENDMSGNKDRTCKLTDENWKELESALRNVFQN